MASIAPTNPGLTFLPNEISFPNGQSYKLIQPLTDLRKCHDGSPAETRVVFLCRSTTSIEQDNEYVIKIKIQVPLSDDSTTDIPPGPSTTTSAELKALRLFRDLKSQYTPRFVDFRHDVQGPDGPLPGGYVTFTAMTKMPGNTLLGLKYWSMDVAEREEIKRIFMATLRAIHGQGVVPLDRGLRNIMWDRDTKKLSIIDFELWERSTGDMGDETKEFQRWGLAHRPPPTSWHAEWGL